MDGGLALPRLTAAAADCSGPALPIGRLWSRGAVGSKALRTTSAAVAILLASCETRLLAGPRRNKLDSPSSLPGTKKPALLELLGEAEHMRL